MAEDDLFFLHGSHTPCCTAVVDKHFEGYYVLQYISRGAISLSYDSRNYLLRGRWFWPSLPGPHIRYHVAEGYGYWEHRYVAFKGSLVSRWVAVGLFPPGPQRAPGGRNYARRFDELLGLAWRKGRWPRLRAINILEGLLLELAESRSEEHIVKEPWLEQLMEYLSSPQNYPPDYASLAAEFGMSTSTLRRRFKQRTAGSLHDYTLQSRLAVARNLLVETDLPIKTIARRLDYRDVYFFTRQFKKYAGMPPGVFRKSRQT